jgi:hypothetical protein
MKPRSTSDGKLGGWVPFALIEGQPQDHNGVFRYEDNILSWKVPRRVERSLFECPTGRFARGVFDLFSVDAVAKSVSVM